MPDGIDFIVLWVDGSDPDWAREYQKYSASPAGGDNRIRRYRDLGIFHYWFRGIELFAPWVRKIHLVTCGHLPPWLDKNHPKLNIVKHSDFIPEKYLPVFSSHPIELNVHKIEGLSNEFVLFNDDTFLLGPCKKSDFFKNGKPRDIFSLNAIIQSSIAHIKINNIQTINHRFLKRDIFKRNLFKIFNFRYPTIEIIKTLFLSIWPCLPGFLDPHQPQPFLKSTFRDVWNEEGALLDQTCRHRFRTSFDVSPSLLRYWQLCKGAFEPIGHKDTFSDGVSDLSSAQEFCSKIRSGRYRMAALNDEIDDQACYTELQAVICDCFDELFPHRSAFELEANDIK